MANCPHAHARRGRARRGRWSAVAGATFLVVLLLLPSGPTGSGGPLPGPAPAPPIDGAPRVAAAALARAEASLAAPAVPTKPGWQPIPQTSAPSPRYGAAAAYDPALGELVLFGGTDGSALFGDTWALQTSSGGAPSWTRISASGGPSSRAFSAMAFDPATGELVLVGGLGAAGPLAGTWLFDRSGWSQMNGTNVGKVAGASLSYDEAAGRLLLFGGSAGGVYSNLLDRLTPGGWVAVPTTGTPNGRANASFVYDTGLGATVLLGGCNASGPLGDVWTLVNATWSPGPSTGAPPAACGALAGYDAADGAVFVAGGNRSTGPSNGTFELTVDGSWSTPYLARDFSAITASAGGFDPAAGAMIAVGGWGGAPRSTTLSYTVDTSELNWTLLDPASNPPRRTQAALAYDAGDGYVLMFGGQNHSANGTGGTGGDLPKRPGTTPTSPYYGDTWIFQGFRWRQLAPPAAPPPRRGAVMTYDYRDGYMVLFGGSNDTQYFNDTWTFEGGRWTLRAPTIAPPARRSFGFTYDATDGMVLMFGGHAGTPNPRNTTGGPNYTFFSDLWSFQGGVWKQLHPTGPLPMTTAEPFFAYDPGTGVTVLYGGYHENHTRSTNPLNYTSSGQGQNTFNTTYTFVHDHWTNLSTAVRSHQPPPRAGGDNGGFAFDAQVGGVVMWGGNWLYPNTFSCETLHPTNNTTIFRNCTVQCHVQPDRFGNPGNCTIPSVWLFAAGSWSQLCGSCAPYGRAADGGAYDPAIGGLFTFGGFPNGSAVSSVGMSRFVANLSASPTATDVGYASVFSAMSVGGFQPYRNPVLTYDDGATGPGWTGSHAFADPGNRTVLFSVTDALGNVTTREVTIDVNALPSATLAAGPWGPGLMTGRLNVTVRGGTPPFRLAYTFGDGSWANVSALAVIHPYASPGTYRGTVRLTDAFGELATAGSLPFSLPATPPSALTLTAVPGQRSVPANFSILPSVDDRYGGLAFRWTSTLGTVVGTSTGAVLTLTTPGIAQVGASMVDGANFSRNASTNVTGLPTLRVVPSFAVTAVSCPVDTASSTVRLVANVSGGAAPYVETWTIGGSTASGPSPVAHLAPGSHVPVVLNVQDALGQVNTTARTLLVPPATCGLGTGPMPTLFLAEAGGAALLGLLVAVEIVVLLRRRPRRRPPVRPLGPATGPTDGGWDESDVFADDRLG